MSSPGSTDEWDQVGFIISSRYRKLVLNVLEGGAQTPKDIAEGREAHISHVSRALQRMRDREIVDLKVPETRRKGRLYGLTEFGEQVADQVREVES